MGYAQKLPYYIQPEDYLLLEEKAEFKHEYLDGVIYGWQEIVFWLNVVRQLLCVSHELPRRFYATAFKFLPASLWSSAALMKALNSGCPDHGVDLNSG